VKGHEAAHSAQWIADCWRWRGKVLTGRFAHWCHDWDGLPVDETSSEFDCCNCFSAEERAAQQVADEGREGRG
jgi:hypothetical protein